MFKVQTILRDQRGQLSLIVLIFGTIGIIILSGFIIWADLNLRSAYRNIDADSAFRIAEAGVEYYRWHLAHDPADFQDGTGQPGPYTHEYFDKNGDRIGEFELVITPPDPGSTVVKIRSTGRIDTNPSIEKIIDVILAKSSFIRYAVLSNSDIRFGPGTTVFGPIHSNGGVHFDGLANNLVTSARDQYNDPDHSGNIEFGVHTHISPIDPEPPAPVPLRPDVFQAGRDFPVPAIDFTGIVGDLANMKAKAQTDGSYYAPSDEEGYHIKLKTNDTYDVYKVTEQKKPPPGCIEVLGQHDWDTWTIETEQFIANNAFPANGIIFFEDYVWVEGTIDTAKLTIASGVFPDNSGHRSDIIINNDVTYTNYDGRDILGLIAQGDVTIGLESEDDLRIDAAVIAQNERVGRYYYRPPSGNQERCGPYDTRNQITIYGALITHDRYGFAYTDGTGYQIRNITYDNHLLYNPPPDFPTTSDGYQQIFWREVK